MKQILNDDKANVKMVGSVVGLLVMIIISVLVFYNMAASVAQNQDALDDDVAGAMGKGTWPATNTTEAGNATDDILGQTATFFTIAPIIAIVIVAVVILGYVSKI